MDKLNFRRTQLSEALNFIKLSCRKDGGSSAYYSKLFNPVKGWSNAYPETTGYIIPTLYDSKKYDKKFKEYEKLASDLTKWLISIQNSDGSFTGSLYNKKNKSSQSVFNTAQIIIGLCRSFEEKGEQHIFDSLTKSSLWLVQEQNPDGSWDLGNYIPGFNPSYYTRVAWPMIMAGKILKNNDIVISAKKTLDLISDRICKNSFVNDCGFKKGKPAFLHTIAYTIRGFLESSFILNNKKYFDIAYNFAEKLMVSYEVNGKINGELNNKFKSNNNYRCLTGEAQMAIIWLKIFDKKNDVRFLNASLKIIDSLCESQINRSIFFTKGGICGSKPYYKDYMRFRQPNWATKFFIDAIILEKIMLNKIK